MDSHIASVPVSTHLLLGVVIQLLFVFVAMNHSSRSRFFSSYTTDTVTYIFQDEHSPPQQPYKTIKIPIASPSDPPSTAAAVTGHLPTQSRSQEFSSAVVKIQSAYRSYVVRSLVKKIRAVDSEANHLQHLIQRQETVDAIRTNKHERIRINEALMKLLLTLDSVPGIDSTVRELSRHVSRRIVGLQEILESVPDVRVERWDGFLTYWDDIIAGIEEEICRERGGGHELERFCAENLGFQCLQRFLREQ